MAEFTEDNWLDEEHTDALADGVWGDFEDMLDEQHEDALYGFSEERRLAFYDTFPFAYEDRNQDGEDS